MAIAARAAASATLHARCSTTAPAQCDQLRNSRQHITAYRHRERTGFAATATSLQSPQPSHGDTRARQPVAICRAKSKEGGDAKSKEEGEAKPRRQGRKKKVESEASEGAEAAKAVDADVVDAEVGNNEEDDEGFVFNDGMMPNEEDFRRLAEMDEPEDPNFDNVLVDDEIMAKLEDIAIMEARAKAFVFPEHLVAASRATSMPTPLLDPEEAWENLQKCVTAQADDKHRAFFSSVLGGIVTDVALMVLHMDDHMVHRGHGIYQTVRVVDGCVWMLKTTMDCLIREGIDIAANSPLSEEQMRRTILETIAAGRIVNGYARFWLSIGRGSFGLSSTECPMPSFYVQAFVDHKKIIDHTVGFSVKTSPVPLYPKYFAGLTLTSNFNNVLNYMDAEVEGFDHGLWVDEDDHVWGAPDHNVAILTQDDTLVTPPWSKIPRNPVMARLFEMLPEFVQQGDIRTVRRLEQRPITVAEAKGCREMFLTSVFLPLKAITHWDRKPIGNGEVGRGVLELFALLYNDFIPDKDHGENTPVPFGAPTNMEDDRHANLPKPGRPFGNAAGPFIEPLHNQT
mmetsp:Transcript_11726/g.35174  ORF Transcript_11726/g.35174 Transcript_11726/m.35174 type:complete len:568 (+) Transcript_11726:137-1840(+)|eukprot:CAMPEP_0206139968 /NCGR_PEP_ID=MMETSP1473-20131121/7835_1 /ASSEMBLY_ACC=CAM_ASM_001109 /TAXON_ID=1461547 /ORGANISM="Stichococcus sp, Strain RCC1054" /LENGTH=567 /DNA_ID=CAMNT_0053533925 /DNA_START=137 /DNA_END=1840 /DNA_ORIENTATION=-